MLFEFVAWPYKTDRNALRATLEPATRLAMVIQNIARRYGD